MGGLKLQHSSGSLGGLWKFRLSGPNPTVFDPAGGGGPIICISTQFPGDAGTARHGAAL